MATERIDIVVTERGTRTVRRNIESLATAAEKADSEFNALKAAISRITPTQQLNTLLQQINGVRDSLAGSRSMKNWMKISIEDANRAIVELSANLRSIRAAMAGSTDWAAITKFRQAEETLEDIIAKLQRIRSMQNLNVNSAAGLRATGGVAPHIPQVITLPETARFAREAEEARRNADRLAEGINRAGNAAKGAHNPFLLLNRYVGAFGSIMIGQQLMQLADSATVVSNRVTIVSSSVKEAEEGVQELYNIARRTRTPIEEMAQLYQKVMMASKELGISQREAFRFVEAVGMGLAVQGSSANTARGALIQLSQAIGTDIVRAEEFNSILEGAYPIALAAARGIDQAGGSVAALRRLVIDGKVSSREFFDAIMSQYPQIADMFSKTTPTISQSFTILRNRMTEYISKSEEAQAISKVVSGSIIMLADNIEPLADVLFSLGIAWGVGFAASKILAVGRMATNVGLMATATTALKAALGFMGGPIVAGLALLAGAAFWVYQNTDNAADQIERLNAAMGAGVTALENYNEWVQIAAQEQTELGGAINLSTEAMLRQSRAQLQEALRALQTEMDTIKDNLSGDSWNPVDMDNMQSALGELAGPGFNSGVIGYGNAELENLYNLLKGVEDGTGTIEAFVAAIERLRGVGPEVEKAASDLATALAALPENPGEAPSAQAELWLRQAEEQLTNIATAIGGFDAQIQAAADATNLPEKVEALTALQEALNVAASAAGFVNNSSWVTETADLLKALDEARKQEALMLEALGANATRLQELTTEAERFRTPMEGSAGAAENTEASLDRINFTPLQDGARGFADELIRAAAAVELIRDRSNSVTVPQGNSGPPQLIDAAYNPNAGGTMTFMSTSGSAGGLDDATHGAMLSALAEYGVPTLNPALLATGSAAANSNFRPGMSADTSLMNATDRTGQSEEYLSILETINQELDARYNNLVLNNEALEQERVLYDVLERARSEGVVLAQQDIALIRERVAALTELEKKVQLISDVGDAVFGNLESALNSFVQTGIFNFNEFTKSVISDLAQIAIQMMIIAPLKNFFGGVLGSLTGVPTASLPAHNEGADFMVGGTGGVDKNVVAFRASRGERVQVTPAGKSADGAAPTIVFNISTPDVEGFRRSEAQMAARAQRMLGRGQRNS